MNNGGNKGGNDKNGDDDDDIGVSLMQNDFSNCPEQLANGLAQSD